MLPFTRPSIGEMEQQAVSEVLASGWLTTGPKARAFEQALAEYIGTGIKVVAFNSATSALETALLACGIGPGDEVIVPAMSFVATANVVLRVGAQPRFVDVELVSRNLTADAVGAVIGPRTRAVIPVHFAGRAVELDPIQELATAHRLVMIEDAAQAVGTRYGKRRIGAAGNPVCFSFHPTKNITTVEGGAVAVGDPQLAKQLERIRFHGIERDDEGNIDVSEWGGKMNLPDVGAAIGLVQLPKLDRFNARRRILAQRYIDRLPRYPTLVIPQDVPGHSWHMFCVCIDFASLGTTRQLFLEILKEEGIAAGVHYPAIHLFSLYRRLGFGPGDFPVAERIGAQTLTLPLFPDMSEDDVDRVCGVLEAMLQGGGASSREPAD